MAAASRLSTTVSAVQRAAASVGPVPTAPSLADWVWAAAFAAALLPVTIVELVRAARTPIDSAWVAGTVALFVVLHLMVAVRRRSPRGALVAASAVMLALTVASLPGTPTIAVLLPSSVTYLVFVFTAAASDDRWADVAAVVFGVAGAALMTAVSIAHGIGSGLGLGPAEPGSLIALAGFLVASIGAAWALGRYRRESRRKRVAQELGREQAAELRLQGEREAVADERRRIGRELHDVISHSLAVMVAQAEASRVLLGRDDPGARTAIEHVVTTGRTAMTDMRGLLTVLAEPPGERVAPLPREPSPGLRDLRGLVERASGPERVVVLIETGAPRAVSPGVGLAAYRVVQESLTNTLKHTDAPTRSEVRLEWHAERLVVTVTDDGMRGGGAHEHSEGRGIRGMRDRAEHVGGLLESAARGADDGWRTRATFPSAPVGSPDVHAGPGGPE